MWSSSDRWAGLGGSFRGGATHSLHLPLPLSAAQLRNVDPAVVAEVDRLLNDHTDAEIVDILNARGCRPGVAERFSLRILQRLCRTYGLDDRYARTSSKRCPDTQRGKRCADTQRGTSPPIA